jgi:hypothetical protein
MWGEKMGGCNVQGRDSLPMEQFVSPLWKEQPYSTETAKRSHKYWYLTNIFHLQLLCPAVGTTNLVQILTNCPSPALCLGMWRTSMTLWIICYLVESLIFFSSCGYQCLSNERVVGTVQRSFIRLFEQGQRICQITPVFGERILRYIFVMC